MDETEGRKRECWTVVSMVFIGLAIGVLFVVVREGLGIKV